MILVSTVITTQQVRNIISHPARTYLVLRICTYTIRTPPGNPQVLPVELIMPPRFRPNYFCRYIPGTLSTVLCNHCTYCTFFFSFFFLRFIFISPFCRSPCSPSPFLFLFRSFCTFVLSFSVCFLYRLRRFYFRAFLGGGFCYSVSSSRRYTPPAFLASLTCANSP